MATEHDDPADDGPAPHGPAATAKGRKGHGLLNGPHREMIIVVCSVAGVGLAFLTLTGGKGKATAGGGGASLPTGAAGALSSGQVAGFDTAAVQGLQASLANQSDMLRNLTVHTPATAGAPTGSTPKPIAASIFAPTQSGNYVNLNGITAEVESDGTLFGMTSQQWSPLAAQGATLSPIGGPQRWYSTQENVYTAGRAQAAAATPAG